MKPPKLVEKFKFRNEEAIKKFESFISENRNNILLICIGYGMVGWIQEIAECIEEPYDIFVLKKYDNLKVLTDSSVIEDNLVFVMKDNSIKFDVPCLCGIFSDEVHP